MGLSPVHGGDRRRSSSGSRWRARVAACLSVTICVSLWAGLSGSAQEPPAGTPSPGRASAVPRGLAALREPAWSPDGGRLAFVGLDRLWTVRPDGSDARPLPVDPAVFGELREPAWSADGRTLAFAANRGDGFDLYTVAIGGSPVRVTALSGDEREPAWTPDGRLVFAHRASSRDSWDLFIVRPMNGPQTASAASSPSPPRPLLATPDTEWQPAVSPDGRWLAFASDRDSADGDLDIWRMPLPPDPASSAVAPASPTGTPPATSPAGRTSRVAFVRGLDAHPAWAPDGRRVAFYGVRGGVAATWVTDGLQPSPQAPAALLARRAGVASWAPDGRTLAIGELPEPEPLYNGNPLRDQAGRPALFDGTGDQLWLVPVPSRGTDLRRLVPEPVDLPGAAWVSTFDRVWDTLRGLYYRTGADRDGWDALRGEYRARAAAAPDAGGFEQLVDEMVARQPLVHAPVAASRAVVVSAHPLASEVGRQVLERGGNIVDAAVAVSFVLGVVEPDASGIGGDGQAVLWLRGMDRPRVVEFKDQVPAAATLDNRRILRDGRIVPDGPAAMNVPGLVAGLDYLHRRYGSRRVGWAELIEPAAHYAETGFVLDETLPSTLAEGRHLLARSPAAARIYLPGGHVPAPGERFVNRDLGATLRAIARGGADTFYHGAIARRIVADLQSHGGVIQREDLAGYQAIEREPVVAHYRGHTLFTGGPPVSAGVSMLEALQVLAHYRPRPGATVATDADYWHYLVESWKVRDELRRPGPDGQPADVGRHLRPEHATTLFRRISPLNATPYAADAEDTVAAASERIGTGTSAFTIADADGNMISVTQTLSSWGGSFYVSPGLGFLYNNHLRASRAPVDDGRGGGEPTGRSAARPGAARSNTASVPTLGFREVDGRLEPRFAIGVAGNTWIPAAGYSIIAGLVDGGLSMQQAIEAPRFLVERDPADRVGAARIAIEDRFPRTLLQALAARGHRFQKIGRKGELRYGYASGVMVDVAAGRVEGGADPRRSHTAVGLDALPADTQQ